jgi:hypothetical protein
VLTVLVNKTLDRIGHKVQLALDCPVVYLVFIHPPPKSVTAGGRLCFHNNRLIGGSNKDSKSISVRHIALTHKGGAEDLLPPPPTAPPPPVSLTSQRNGADSSHVTTMSECKEW